MKQLRANIHNSLVNNPLYDGNSLMPLYEQIPPPNLMQTITFDSLIDETQRATQSDTNIYSNYHQHTRENHYVDQPTCGLNNQLIIATDITEHFELVDPDSCFNNTFSSETQAKCIHDTSPMDVKDNAASLSMIKEKQDDHSEVVNVDIDKNYGTLAPAGLI